MSPDRSPDLVRLFGLLESARPADIRAVVAALPEDDLVTAIHAMRGRISRPAREYILAEGSSSALIALARQAVLGGGEGSARTVDRVLLRFDPEADAAFFELDRENQLVRRARRAILRERTGPDGHAVIAPRVKQILLADAAARLDGALVAELAAADDPDLVLALAPHFHGLSNDQAAAIITTLDAHGRRDEAKRQRGLWEGRGMGFTLLGVRRIAAPRHRNSYPARFRPASEEVEAVSAERYRELVHRNRNDGEHGSWLVRTLAWAALRAGTMTPAEILKHTRPAALAVAVAVCDGAEPFRPGEPRASDDLRIHLAEYARSRLGNDPNRWAYVIAQVNTYEGTIPELIAESSSPSYQRAFVPLNPLAGTNLDPVNILLASMPHNVAALALRTVWLEADIPVAAAKTPLCRAIVDHVIAYGTRAEHLLLATNAATPDSALARLMDQTADPHVLFEIMERTDVGPEILDRAYAAVPRDARLMKWITKQGYAVALRALRCAADDPAWLISVLRKVFPGWGDPGKIAAYVLLAEVAGVEAVWAFELERAGSLAKMAKYVRDSMATGDAEPLIQAAEMYPVPSAPPRNRPRLVPARIGENLDHPLDRPLENLIRKHLDGHPERWLRLADLLRTKRTAADETLIAEAAGAI